MPEGKPWSNQDVATLIELWPTWSAKQIAARLDRTRSAICGKVQRERQQGKTDLPRQKQFAVRPVQVHPPRRKRRRIISTRPLPPAPAYLAMHPCALGELNGHRCRWPLGEVYAVATLFCGGDVCPGLPYCPHHHEIAHRPPREHHHGRAH